MDEFCVVLRDIIQTYQKQVPISSFQSMEIIIFPSMINLAKYSPTPRKKKSAEKTKSKEIFLLMNLAQYLLASLDLFPYVK